MILLNVMPKRRLKSNDARGIFFGLGWYIKNGSYSGGKKRVACMYSREVQWCVVLVEATIFDLWEGGVVEKEVLLGRYTQGSGKGYA